MKVKCLICNKIKTTNRKHMEKRIRYYAEKGYYFCRKCRENIILRVLNDRMLKE